ncbi:MAG: hypothetical protein HKM02_03880 [Pseudomonadales bacterium]|nr:hypothetical protein [Pseudomonadales bacterium]
MRTKLKQAAHQGSVQLQAVIVGDHAELTIHVHDSPVRHIAIHRTQDLIVEIAWSDNSPAINTFVLEVQDAVALETWLVHMTNAQGHVRSTSIVVQAGCSDTGTQPPPTAHCRTDRKLP